MESIILIVSLILNILFAYGYFVKAYIWLFSKSKLLLKLILVKADLKSRSSILINSPVVYRAQNSEIVYLEGKLAEPDSIELPETLLLKPGKYIYENQSYELTQEGLYRFILPEKNSYQKIIYAGNVEKLMSSLAWLVMHGEADDKLKYDKLLKKASKKKLILTCESIAKFAHKFLSDIGIKSRIVGARTLDKWNTYDNGHYLVEVFRSDLDKWVLYDLDSDAYFVKDGRALSLIEYIDCDTYEVIPISSDIKSDRGISKFDFTFIEEARLVNLKQWYKRIMQLIYIDDGNINYSSCQPLTENIIKQYTPGAFPTINFLSRENFIKKFYQ